MEGLDYKNKRGFKVYNIIEESRHKLLKMSKK